MQGKDEKQAPLKRLVVGKSSGVDYTAIERAFREVNGIPEDAAPKTVVLTPLGPHLREGVTGTPGEFIIHPTTVYQVQADGSWKKVGEPLAGEIRKRGK